MWKVLVSRTPDDHGEPAVFWVDATDAADAERVAREQGAAVAAVYGLPSRTGPIIVIGPDATDDVWPRPRIVDGLRVHTFPDSGTAYDHTQFRPDIHDGDVLWIPSEQVAGFLHRAWPIAVTDQHGALHQLTIDGYVIEGRDYTRSAQVAAGLLAEQPRPGDKPGQPPLDATQVRDAAGLPDDTFASFLLRYGRSEETYSVIEVGDSIERWPTIIVRFGDKTALIQLCGADTGNAHLSVDIHAFVADQVARVSAFGMENGRRYPAFDDTAPGTSQGLPAVQSITVMIGRQTSQPDRP